MFNEHIYHTHIVVRTLNSYIKEQKSASKCLILNGTVRDKHFVQSFITFLSFPSSVTFAIDTTTLRRWY